VPTPTTTFFKDWVRSHAQMGFDTALMHLRR
jgi:hypothetical protein